MTICRSCHSAVQRDITIGEDRAAEFPRTRHLTVEHNSAVILVAVCDPALQDYAFGILDATRIALRLAGIPVERMRTTDSLTKAGQWLDPDAGEQGPTLAYTDAAAVLVAEGGIMSRRSALFSSPLCWPTIRTCRRLVERKYVVEY